MKNINRVMSIIVLISFVFNTSIYDTSFYKMHTRNKSKDKLASPSLFSTLVGVEHKDIRRAKIVFQAILKDTAERLSADEDEVDLDTFKVQGRTTASGEMWEYGMQVFFSEAKDLIEDGNFAYTRVRFSYDRHGARTYYAVFSKKAENGIFSVEALPERDWSAEKVRDIVKKLNGIPDRTADRDEAVKKDGMAIDRDVRHEKTVDAVIKFVHDRPSLGLVKVPLKDRYNYEAYIKRITHFLGLNIVTPEGLNPLEERNFYLIRLTPEAKEMIAKELGIDVNDLLKVTVPVYNENGEYLGEEETYCDAHSSNENVHVFVDENVFDLLTEPDIKEVRKRWSVRKRRLDVIAASNIVNERVRHEVGGMLDFPVLEVDKRTHRAINGIDRRFERRMASLTSLPFINVTAADLDTIGLRRDFAAAGTAHQNISGYIFDAFDFGLSRQINYLDEIFSLENYADLINMMAVRYEEGKTEVRQYDKEWVMRYLDILVGSGVLEKANGNYKVTYVGKEVIVGINDNAAIPLEISVQEIEAYVTEIIFKNLRSKEQDVREKTAADFKAIRPVLAKEIDAYYASLPISGKSILQTAIALGRPVLACNIDNGELSALLQIEPMMRAALDKNAFIILEVGPDALLTYAEGKPHLPEYCARVAYRLYKETGKSVTYAVHLDHNQINAKDYYKGSDEDKQKALQAAIDRAKFALNAAGFTSFATDTSTITELGKETVLEQLMNVIQTGKAIIDVIEEGAKELGIEVGHEGEVGDIGKSISTVEEALTYIEKLEHRLDVIALNLGTAHGYDFYGNIVDRDFDEIIPDKTPRKELMSELIEKGYIDENGFILDKFIDLKSWNGLTLSDKFSQFTENIYGIIKYSLDHADELKPYKQGRINVGRAKEVHEALRARGEEIGVALHGFSGTPIDYVPEFINKGIAKVNINTDWQAIIWKVLEVYYYKLYRKVFMLARESAKKDKKMGKLVTDNVEFDFTRARNRIMFGFARKIFRKPEFHPLLEEITNALLGGNAAPERVARAQLDSDYKRMKLTFSAYAEPIRALQAIQMLTYDRVRALMEALKLKDSAKGIEVNRERELRLQEWQQKNLREMAADESLKECTLEELLSRITVSESEDLMGKAAAEAILEDMEKKVDAKGKAVILFASAASQHTTWKWLVKLWGQLPEEQQKYLAERIVAFHMDEYLGLPEGAPQAFGKVLREKLFETLGFKNVYYFDTGIAYDEAAALRQAIERGASEEDIERMTKVIVEMVKPHIAEIVNKFKKHGGKFDIVIGGVGKIPHVAFNDPDVADFNDIFTIKVVRIDNESRLQQVIDGEFKRIEDVPTHAFTFTLPPIFSADSIYIIVPREFKADSVRRTLEEKISEKNPATGLRMPKVIQHVKFFFDRESIKQSKVAQRAYVMHEINEMTDIAREVGLQIPTQLDKRYRLMVPFSLHTSEEYRKHSEEYRDRFELIRVGNEFFLETYISNIIDNAEGQEQKSVAFIPYDSIKTPGEANVSKQLKRLTDRGIRFIFGDVGEFAMQTMVVDKDAEAQRKAKQDREKFQINTYAEMLVWRFIDSTMNESDKAYRLLSFFLKSHFVLQGNLSAKDYIQAIVTGNIATLIKGYLAYKPAEPYDAREEYDNIAQELISA